MAVVSFRDQYIRSFDDFCCDSERATYLAGLENIFLFPANIVPRAFCLLPGSKIPKYKFPEVKCKIDFLYTAISIKVVHRAKRKSRIFEEIVTDDSHKLYNLLPPRNETVNMTLRSSHRFNVAFQTNRFKNSFIIHNALNYSS